MAQQQARPRHTFGKGEVRALVALVAVIAIMLAAMFGGAGTLDWPRGWVFFAFYWGLAAIACVWLWIANPEIFAVRARMRGPALVISVHQHLKS